MRARAWIDYSASSLRGSSAVPKVAAYLLAQAISLALALGATYVLNRTPGLEPAPGGNDTVTWPVISAWAIILCFVTPALYRLFRRGPA